MVCCLGGDILDVCVLFLCCQVSVYNLIPPDEDYTKMPRAADETFRVGRRLQILEPFYKVQLDGTLGIRVDNPAELVWGEPGASLGPADAAGLQAEGNAHVKARQYEVRGAALEKRSQFS